jgi:hypothetical protein
MGYQYRKCCECTAEVVNAQGAEIVGDTSHFPGTCDLYIAAHLPYTHTLSSVLVADSVPRLLHTQALRVLNSTIFGGLWASFDSAKSWLQQFLSIWKKK